MNVQSKIRKWRKNRPPANSLGCHPMAGHGIVGAFPVLPGADVVVGMGE